MTKIRINLYLTPETAILLNRAVAAGRASKSAVIEAAIKQFLDPRLDNGPVELIARRLDAIVSAIERLSRDAGAQSETLAMFVLYYLCITPPVPDTQRAASEAIGKLRFEDFMRKVAERLNGDERYVRALIKSQADPQRTPAPSRIGAAA